eukprot:scaffold186862_cov16-Tisochrysis_lutea.AAC.1
MIMVCKPFKQLPKQALALEQYCLRHLSAKLAVSQFVFLQCKLLKGRTTHFYLLAGASVSDAAGTGSAKIQITNKQMADFVNNNKDAVKTDLLKELGSKLPAGSTATGASITVNSDTVTSDVSIKIDAVSRDAACQASFLHDVIPSDDDNAAQKEVKKFISNNKGTIEGASKAATPDSITVQSDDITITGDQKR